MTFRVVIYLLLGVLTTTTFSASGVEIPISDSLEGPNSISRGTVNPVLLDHSTELYCLNDQALFLPVYEKHITAQDAWETKDRFLSWENVSITRDEKEVWVCFSIKNNTDRPNTFYLNGKMTDYVELYQILNGQPERVTSSGYLMPFDDRPVLDWGLIIRHSIPAGSTQKYLYRLKSVTKNSRHLMDYALPDCIKLYMQSGYENTYKLRRRLTYFFLGVIFVMFVYNLCISFITLYREYFLFSLYNIATVLTCLFLTDAHLETRLLQTEDWIRNVQYICFSGIFLCYLLFSLKCLDLKINMPVIYRVLKWVPWAYLIIFVCLVLSYYTISLYLTIVIGTLSFLITWYCSMRLSVSIPSARFLLIANFIICTIGFFYVANLMGWVSTNVMIHTGYTLQMIEVVVFSFAVAYKLRVSKRAMHQVRYQNEMQKEKLNMEEAIRKQLEKDVNQKARSLTTTSIQLLNFNDKLTEVIDKIKMDVRTGNNPWEYVIRELDNLKQPENYWKGIKIHFENVHPDFFSKLERNFPHLTSNDHKLLAFLKMKLSNKEIAIILNVSRRAVEQAKRRVKKKLGMDPDNMDIVGFAENASIQSEV
ncbi:hypothetical protein FNH22_30220 [Fulvivirga sp. M361]|nr:hypothetical protein FNH22_30220 [Fulvivirga sp. M361]